MDFDHLYYLYGKTIKFNQNKTVDCFCIIHPWSLCQAKQNFSFVILQKWKTFVEKKKTLLTLAIRQIVYFISIIHILNFGQHRRHHKVTERNQHQEPIKRSPQRYK